VRYVVHFKGVVYVDADNKAEALEDALDNLHMMEVKDYSVDEDESDDM